VTAPSCSAIVDSFAETPSNESRIWWDSAPLGESTETTCSIPPLLMYGMYVCTQR
jgi:hypothetical protein